MNDREPIKKEVAKPSRLVHRDGRGRPHIGRRVEKLKKKRTDHAPQTGTGDLAGPDTAVAASDRSGLPDSGERSSARRPSGERRATGRRRERSQVPDASSETQVAPASSSKPIAAEPLPSAGQVSDEGSSSRVSPQESLAPSETTDKRGAATRPARVARRGGTKGPAAQEGRKRSVADEGDPDPISEEIRRLKTEIASGKVTTEPINNTVADTGEGYPGTFPSDEGRTTDDLNDKLHSPDETTERKLISLGDDHKKESYPHRILRRIKAAGMQLKISKNEREKNNKGKVEKYKVKIEQRKAKLIDKWTRKNFFDIAPEDMKERMALSEAAGKQVLVYEDSKEYRIARRAAELNYEYGMTRKKALRMVREGRRRPIAKDRDGVNINYERRYKKYQPRRHKEKYPGMPGYYEFWHKNPPTKYNRE